MIDSSDSLVILKWSKNYPENHYLTIAILWVAAAVAAAALNDLKIQLRLNQEIGVGMWYPKIIIISYKLFLKV